MCCFFLVGCKMLSRCHQLKKEALLQLCNFLSCKSISHITDLANGEILFKTIEVRFPSFSEVELQSREVNENNAQLNDNKMFNEDPENKPNPAIKENIFLHHIKKFIDDHYNIKSENFLQYNKCIDFDEFEILKMTAFVLCEIIKHLIDTRSAILDSLCNIIDVKFQHELESIFKVFISEREKLNNEEVEKVFTKTAVSPTTTPRRPFTRHREHQSAERISPQKEDVYSNSPLKIYFESPIFKKEGVWMKEKVKFYEKTLIEGEEDFKKLERKLTILENNLKNKEKDLKCLQKKNEEKEEENQCLFRNMELLKIDNESLSKELTKVTCDYEFEKLRVAELLNQVEELQLNIKEESKSVKRRRSSSQLHENKSLNAKGNEITQLKDKLSKLLIENHLYRKEIASDILAKIDEKMSDGTRNQTYEEEWYIRDLERREAKQMLSTIEYQNLITKLKLSQLENERLLKEMENIKKEFIGKNQKLETTELKDTLRIPEKERLRNSLNKNSFILNNSDVTPDEHSVISSEPETLPCSTKTCEAALWKMYDFQNYQIESTCDNLSHDSVISEKFNLDVMKDLHSSNIMEIVEPGGLLNQKNKYVLGNLHFDAFFNELKKLTTNGSFQKVLEVFGRRQTEINGRNGCNYLDLQEMLKVITECVGATVALNKEAIINLEDKCVSTDEKELSAVIELKFELEKLKNQLTAAAQKYQIDLKERQKTIEELKQDKKKLENKYQTSADMISEIKKCSEGWYKKYREQVLKNENLHRKYAERKKSYESIMSDNLKLLNEFNDLKKLYTNVCKKKNHYEKLQKVLQEENTEFKEKLKMLKEEKKNLLKEKEAWSVGSAAYSRDSCSGLPSNLNFNTFQETCNESVLSSAFHKSISHYVSENEDDFCYYNSLNPVKKQERVEEIKRRNSLYPSQLQSSYPLEVDLNATYKSLYINNQTKEHHHHHSKKLKYITEENPITEEKSLFETPISKNKKKIETPLSFHRLMQRVKRMKT